MSTQIQNQPHQNRYVLLENGEEAGFVDYHLHRDEIVLTHTEVDPARRRTGIASALVTGALDDVRIGTGLKVVPECPFVARFIDTHPEYHELVERG